MNPLFEAAKEISDFMNVRKWRYCIIGGLALLRWGEPRVTLDVDVTLLTGFGKETDYIDKLLLRFESRIPNALEFALQNRILLLRSTNGKDLDISLGALPFEKKMIAHATPFTYAEGIKLITCSAEDLFILKAFAGRAKDWGDAESIAIRQHGKMDLQYIMTNLKSLYEIKETPERLEYIRNILGIR